MPDPAPHELDGYPANLEAIGRCDIIFINLRHRTDRCSAIQSEFERIGVNHYRRFDAIAAEPGGLGCALSHLGVLETWPQASDRLLLIAEDDCQFLVSSSEINKLISAFQRSAGDVLCLAYSVFDQAPVENEQLFMRAFDTQTTACYIVKPHMVELLIQAAKQSIEHFRDGIPYERAAIDRVWKNLQRTSNFYVPVERAARQRPSFSDIEQRFVDYAV